MIDAIGDAILLSRSILNKSGVVNSIESSEHFENVNEFRKRKDDEQTVLFYSRAHEVWYELDLSAIEPSSGHRLSRRVSLAPLFRNLPIEPRNFHKFKQNRN